MNISKVYNNTTTTGKSGKALFWSALSVIILAILTAITGNPALFAWHSGVLVIIANVLIVYVKNFLDSDTKNF